MFAVVVVVLVLVVVVVAVFLVALTECVCAGHLTMATKR